MTVSSELTSSYPCADGSTLEVAWETAEDLTYAWRQDREHWVHPVSPLEAELWRIGRPGTRRAYDESAVVTPIFFSRPLIVRGFAYWRVIVPVPGERPEWWESAERLLEQYDNPFAVWEQHCLPTIKDACTIMRVAPMDPMDNQAVPLDALAELWLYTFHRTHVALLANAVPGLQLDEFCGKQFGDEGPAIATALKTGSWSETLRANQLLWEMAQIVGRNAPLREAVLGARPDHLPADWAALPGGAELQQAFAAYLDTYGERADGWELLRPTARERPATPLGIIRRFVETGAPAPAEAGAESARGRAALLAELEGRLADDTAAVAELRRLAAANELLTAVREDRAHWQLTNYGVLRATLLRRGAALAASGAIEAPDDVFFLLPYEIEAPAEHGDLRARVAERRREYDRSLTAGPPPVIGAPLPPAPAPAPGAADPAADEGLLRGLPASRGVLTGRACVARDLEDAERLQPGQVLVCAMTSPPWTPFFGIAAAVVTDTGAPFSHPGIAAREYGIPCVVGAKGATETIPDGALITVDGTAGTVRVERGSAA